MRKEALVILLLLAACSSFEPTPLTGLAGFDADDVSQQTEPQPPALFQSSENLDAPLFEPRKQDYSLQPLIAPDTEISDTRISADCTNPITSCCDITAPGAYTLANNISTTSSCLNIQADDVSIDCLGFTVSWTSSFEGINSFSNTNTNITNCILNGTNGPGMWISSSPVVIVNNTITTFNGLNDQGIILDTVSNSTIANNTITTQGTSLNHGIRVMNSEHTNIVNNTITINGTSNAFGIFFDDATTRNNNITARNNSIRLATTGSDNAGIDVEIGHNITLDTNTIATNGTTRNYGIWVDSGGLGTRVYNNTIFTNGSSSSNFGIYLQLNVANATVENNTIQTNGTSLNAGIRLETSISNTTVRNNTVRTAGSSSSNHGIQLFSTVFNNTVENNTIAAGGTSAGQGIRLSTSANENTIQNNIVRTQAVGTSAFAIELSSSSRNIVRNNTLFANGTNGGNIGISLVTSASNNNIRDNNVFTDNTAAVTTTSNFGIAISGGTANNVTNNTITTRGTGKNNKGFVAISSATSLLVTNNSISTFGTGSDDGLFVDFISFGVFENLTIAPGPASYGLNLSFSSGVHNFTNITLYPSSGWIKSSTFGANFTNLTFVTPDGNMRFPNVEAFTNYDMTLSKLNILPFRAFLNASSLPDFNTNAQITLSSIPLLDPAIIVDPEEDGIFTYCTNCTIDSFTLNSLVFNVTGFSSYAATGDLSTNKTDSVDPAIRSTILNYTINVTNFGLDDLFNISVTETYPTGITFISSEPIATSGNNVFNFSTLSAGTSVLINISVLVTANNGTTLNNSYNITFQNQMGQTTALNNSELTLVLGYPNITGTKNATAFAERDQLLTYTINLTNNGDEISYNTTAVETYPADVIFVTSSITPIDSANTTFDLGNVYPGNSTNFTITVRINTSVVNGSSLNNTANITYANQTGQNDTTQLNSSTIGLGLPALFINKTSTPIVQRGSLFNYTIQVTNNGDDDAFNVSLVDLYHLQSVFINSTIPSTNSNTTFDLGNITPGQTITFIITVNTTSNTTNGTIINNTINATYSRRLGASNATSNSTLLTVLGAPNITATKTDTPDPVVPGGTLTYTITVINNGDEIAYNTTLVEGYPHNVTLHATNIPPTSGNNTFSLGNITPGQTVTLTITLNVSSGFIGTFNNTINLTFQDFFGNTTNTTATQSTIVRTPTSGGGGSSGAGGAATGVASVQSMTSNSMTTSYMSVNDKVTFSIDNEDHALAVLSVSTDTVTVRVSSIPQEFILKKGAVQAVDVNQDGRSDIRVRVQDIAYSKALFYLEKTALSPAIERETPAPSPAPSEQAATQTASPTQEETIPTIESQNQPIGLAISTPESRLPTLSTPLMLALILAPLIIILVLLLYRRPPKPAQNDLAELDEFITELDQFLAKTRKPRK